MKPLTLGEIQSIEANVFHAVRPIVRERPDFPWHRNRAGNVTVCQPNSSQALAVSFFGTINTLTSRDAIFEAWVADLQLSLDGPWKIELEVALPGELLREPRPTQVDALATGGAGLVLFECKFTEPDGGGCSQPIPLPRGRHRGLRQCDGNFADQVNPLNAVRSRCALTGKGIKYWELISDVLKIDPETEHRPCPFASGWYQWMRNLVAARAIGRHHQHPSAFVVVYADGPFPMALRVRTAEWDRLNSLTEGLAVPLRTVSYQRLHAVATAAAPEHEQPILDDLRVWMDQKLTSVAKKAES